MKRFLCLVGTARYFADDDSGKVYVTHGLSLLEIDPKQEAGLLRRWARANQRLAREFPQRVLYQTLAHQQRVAAGKIEQAARQAVAV
jgi:hypothetical protein